METHESKSKEFGKKRSSVQPASDKNGTIPIDTTDKNGPINIDTTENCCLKTNNSDVKSNKFKMIKNVILLSFSFTCLYTAFLSLMNIQSTLNIDDGIGTGGLAVVYSTVVISCMLLPKFAISLFGCKWTMALSALCFIAYMTSNLYASWVTIGAASVVLGVGGSTLWSAKSSYLTQLAIWYAKATGTSEVGIINIFFGVFFMAYQTAQIWGNLISSAVFFTTHVNRSTVLDLSKCGANFDPILEVKNNSNLERPEDIKVYTLIGIYIGLCVVAFVTIVFLINNISLDQTDTTTTAISLELFQSTTRHFLDSRTQKLLTLLTIYNGMEQAFIASDFTQSFVSCTLGIGKVGYVMICYGVVDAVCSFLFGRLVQYFGRVPFFLLAFLSHGGTLLALILWQPNPEEVHWFYILAAMWGIGDAIFIPQMYALYGYLFTTKTEVAFANYKLWESLGSIMAFAWSGILLTRTKILICISVLLIGMVGYVIVEVKDHKGKITAKIKETVPIECSTDL